MLLITLFIIKLLARINIYKLLNVLNKQQQIEEKRNKNKLQIHK